MFKRSKQVSLILYLKIWSLEYWQLFGDWYLEFGYFHVVISGSLKPSIFF